MNTTATDFGSLATLLVDVIDDIRGDTLLLRLAMEHMSTEDWRDGAHLLTIFCDRLDSYLERAAVLDEQRWDLVQGERKAREAQAKAEAEAARPTNAEMVETCERLKRQFEAQAKAEAQPQPDTDPARDLRQRVDQVMRAWGGVE